MKSVFFKYILALMAMLASAKSIAQSFAPYGEYTSSEGQIERITSADGFSGSAPLTVKFVANPTGSYPPQTLLEWHFYAHTNPNVPMLIRYEGDTEYTFNKAGAFKVVLYEILDGDTLSIYDPINISIGESELVMPNAFTPNGDGINDIYKAKKGYKSIVEFRAIVFNRWGQKLYEWTDPAGGWDGKFNGKDVQQGVYFVNVKAKGADGREFHIRRDVNLIRDYNEAVTNTP